jgi:hypothetical protein
MQRVPAPPMLQDNAHSPLMANAGPVNSFPLAQPYNQKMMGGKQLNQLNHENGWQAFWDSETGGPNGIDTFQKTSTTETMLSSIFALLLLLIPAGLAIAWYIERFDLIDVDGVMMSTWTFSFVVWTCCALGLLYLAYEIARTPTRFISRLISNRRLRYLHHKAMEVNANQPDYGRHTELLNFALDPRANFVQRWTPFTDYTVFCTMPSDFCPRSLSEYSNARGSSANKLIMFVTNVLAVTAGIKIFISEGYPNDATWIVGWIACIALLGVGNFETNSFVVYEIIHSLSMLVFMGFMYGHLLKIAVDSSDWPMFGVGIGGVSCFLLFLLLSFAAGVYGHSPCASAFPLGPANSSRCGRAWLTSYALMLLELAALLVTFVLLTYDWVIRDNLRMSYPVV